MPRSKYTEEQKLNILKEPEQIAENCQTETFPRQTIIKRGTSILRNFKSRKEKYTSTVS